MRTFGDVVSEVLNYGFNDGPQVNRKRIEAWVNEAQKQVASQVEAPEFQETALVTLAPEVSKYALPADFDRMQSVYYPEMTQRLRPMDLQTFDNVGATEGPPDRYTLYKNELWLFPIPNNTDKLELRYIKQPAVMEAETDVPILSEMYLHLLVQYALVRAYEAEDDAEFANIHQQRFDRDMARYGVSQQDRQVDRPKQLDGTWASAF